MADISDIARDYIARGWAVVPIPHRSKSPVVKDWPNLRITTETIPQFFNGKPQNIGVILGTPSGNLVDIDIDHPAVNALAHDYLPPTDAVFGHKSNPSSHYLYRTTKPIFTTNYFLLIGKSKLVEVRSTGGQTVFPGSTHVSGEPVEWEGTGEPALIEESVLVEAVERLAHDAARELGDSVRPKQGEPPVTPQPIKPPPQASGKNVTQCRHYLEKMDDAVSGSGGHNQTFLAACTCFRFGLTPAESAEMMRWFNSAKCIPQWKDRELQHKIDEAHKRVFADGELGSKLRTPPPKPPVVTAAATDPDDIVLFPLTDAGNGERFAARWRDMVRFDSALGRWRIYDGTRWRLDQTNRTTALAVLVVRDMLKTAAHVPNADYRENLAKWAIKCEARDKISAMLDMSKAVTGMTITPDQWDADPWKFNCASGTIDLRQGSLQQHNPQDLLTLISPVEYDPQAVAPRWTQFLTEIFDGSDDVISYLQRWHGYSLSAQKNEHLMPVYYGTGNNGKSVMLDTISAIMGEYAQQAPPDLLTEKHGSDGHPTEIADLMGKRLVIASETEKNRRLKVALVKRLTGDARLKGRYMRQDFFEFPRTFSLILVTNNKPKIEEDSEGIWRRVKLVPFSVTIPEDQRDTDLLNKLMAESAGILRWLVDGFGLWQSSGMGNVETITQATLSYRQDSDPLGEFIAACCIIAPNCWAASESLRNTYERFCKENGEHAVSGNDFREALRKRGCELKRVYAGRGWQGIGINTESQPQPTETQGTII